MDRGETGWTRAGDEPRNFAGKGASQRPEGVGLAGVVHVVEPDEAMQAHLMRLAIAEGLAFRVHEDVEGFFTAGYANLAGCLVIDAGLADAERTSHVALPIVVTARPADFAPAVRAIRAGVTDILQKPFDDEEVLASIRAAIRLDGERRLQAERLARLRACFDTLTPRERQVMALVTAGKLNKQVGGDLGLSEITVKAHRGAVMRKMQAASLAALVRMADALARPTGLREAVDPR